MLTIPHAFAIELAVPPRPTTDNRRRVVWLNVAEQHCAPA
jgi:hypothetical protein